MNMFTNKILFQIILIMELSFLITPKTDTFPTGNFEPYYHDSPFYEDIVKRGHYFNYPINYLDIGEPLQCYKNSADYWFNNSVKICVGLCLTDGIWYNHAWCYDGRQIIEFRQSATRYFGYILTDEESQDFYEMYHNQVDILLKW